MEEKNNVGLWDLPEDKVYVKIKEDVRYEFFKFVKTNYGGAKKLSKLLKTRIETAYIYNWKHAIRFCPLWFIKPLISDNKNLSKLIQDNIEGLKSRSNGTSINGIKFPLNLSKCLARMCGHLIGDGGIISSGIEKYRVYYANKSRFLIKQFKTDMLETFGKLEFDEYLDSRYDVIQIKIPKIIGIILTEFFGLQSKNFKHIPKSIKDADKDLKTEFLKSLFDDEGSVHIKGRKITLGVTARNVLIETKKLLEELDIETSDISETHRAGNRKPFYNLTITGWWNFERFREFVGFYHPLKSTGLKTLIDSLSHYRLMPHETRNIIIQTIKSKNGMTIKDLDKELNRPIETLKYHLHNLEKAKIIKSSVAKQNLKIYYGGN